MAIREGAPSAAGIGDLLASVDWDFVDARPAPLDGIHPYPAKFISSIPRTLIEMFRPEHGLAVFDPFCGSGTTLSAAVDAGLPCIGVDLNPIAVLISRLRTAPLDEPLSERAIAIADAARDESARVPDLPRLDHWFKKDVQAALASLMLQIDAVASASTRDALRLCLSRIIVRVSNQDSDTRYAAVEKNTSGASVFTRFVDAARSVEAALETRDPATLASASARVVQADILAVRADEVGAEVGLTITSPPYPNAYEYWLYHKYRMYWLGFDPVAVREAEIGARPHYFKKDHQTEADFEVQMERCFHLLAQVMVPGGVACFVVGRSMIHGRLIDNAALLRRAAATAGFVFGGSATRAIRKTRKAFNLSHGKINDETILAFQLA